MDKSFHYYCIRVLAEQSGFPAKDAQTIAYASQYTDDSTEHGKMTIVNIPVSLNYPRWDPPKNTFDPVCTAHSADTWMRRLWKWAKFYLKPDVQRRVLMPFHFLPSEALPNDNNTNTDKFNFVTRQNSYLVKQLVDNALQAFSGAKGPAYQYALVKLGIALHTYADSWSHDGFSGRHNSKENDIKKIKVRKGNTFNNVNPPETFISYAAPDVGHAEAGTIPDDTNIQWTAAYAGKAGRIGRDNPQEFLGAAKEIFDRLCSVSPGNGASWPTLSTKIGTCLKNTNSWEDSFQNIDFGYSRFSWRAAALTGDSIHWDNFDDEKDFQKLRFQYTGNDMRWLFFHQAAHEQRLFLDQKIPNTWISN